MQVRFTLLTEMLGTSPADEEVFKTYVASKGPNPEEESIESIEEKGTTVFRRMETGNLCMMDYHIKGALKSRGDAIRARTEGMKNKAAEATLEGDKPKKRGGATKWGTIKGKLDDDVHVFPREIDLGINQPDGIRERPLRAMTMQGARVSLARSEYINAGRSFECEIAVRPGRITEEMIYEMLYEMRFVGLGQWRNAGHGRCDIEVKIGGEWKPLVEVAEVA